MLRVLILHTYLCPRPRTTFLGGFLRSQDSSKHTAGTPSCCSRTAFGHKGCTLQLSLSFRHWPHLRSEDVYSWSELSHSRL